jgi:hypothetical protein
MQVCFTDQWSLWGHQRIHSQLPPQNLLLWQYRWPLGCGKQIVQYSIIKILKHSFRAEPFCWRNIICYYLRERRGKSFITILAAHIVSQTYLFSPSIVVLSTAVAELHLRATACSPISLTINAYGAPSVCSVSQVLYFLLHIICKKKAGFNFSATRLLSIFLVLNFPWTLIKYYIDGSIL